jgi:hypothetical protein
MAKLEGIMSHMDKVFDNLVAQNKTLYDKFEDMSSKQEQIIDTLVFMTNMMEQSKKDMSKMQLASSPSSLTGDSDYSSQKRAKCTISADTDQEETQEYIMRDPKGGIAEYE